MRNAEPLDSHLHHREPVASPPSLICLHLRRTAHHSSRRPRETARKRKDRDRCVKWFHGVLSESYFRVYSQEIHACTSFALLRCCCHYSAYKPRAFVFFGPGERPVVKNGLCALLVETIPGRKCEKKRGRERIPAVAILAMLSFFGLMLCFRFRFRFPGYVAFE